MQLGLLCTIHPTAPPLHAHPLLFVSSWCCPQILRVHISSEDDPYFLHTLEVSEEEFQSLKAEQGILVDFANFPTKLISLLEKCLSSQASDMPRFQAVLSTHTSESTFRVIETNDFKQLPHITLMFKPGNDFAVKQVGAGGKGAGRAAAVCGSSTGLLQLAAADTCNRNSVPASTACMPPAASCA
jgi:hypothetical protein